MKRLCCLSLLSFLLIACVATEQNYAPAALKDTQITFTITKTTSENAPSKTYPETGVLISYFDANAYFGDATDLAVSYWGGTYSYTKSYTNNETNKVTINQTSVDGFPVISQLIFTSKNSGTFVTNIIFAENYQFRQEGTFVLKPQKFKVLPANINNRNFNLFVKQIDNSVQGLEAVAVDQQITATFSGGIQTFALPAGQIFTNSSYNLEASTFELLVSGQFQGGHAANVLHLTFNSFMTGQFSLDIGDAKNVASGVFNSNKFTSIDTAVPLKGKIIADQTITSAVTQVAYPYRVYLPENYDNVNKSYPVLYVTDGQWNSDFTYLLEKHNKEMIMVSLPQTNERRNIDFMPPGTTNYSKFLKTELIPQIEKTYRHNGNRSFFGASLGGLLGAALVADETTEGAPYFKNYLLVDAALWGATPDLVAQEELHSRLPIRLLLTHTRQGNGLWVNQYAERVQAKNYKDLFMVNLPYNQLTHEQTGPIAFEDLIELIDDMPQEVAKP